MRVAIDGLIGCGKSTLLNRLRDRDGFEVAQEPVERWRDLLVKFYTDQQKWSLALQTLVFATLSDSDGVIHERSPQSTMVFAQTLHTADTLNDEEFGVYSTLVRKFGWTPEVCIFLICSPETCRQRISLRNGNPGDALITLEYLQQLDKNYTRRMATLGKHVVYVDAEEDAECVYHNVIGILERHFTSS